MLGYGWGWTIARFLAQKLLEGFTTVYERQHLKTLFSRSLKKNEIPVINLNN